VEAYDPARPYWEQGGFRAVSEEVEATSLEVTGALPPELRGLYVRNGSNPRSGRSPHWFLGDGMLHGVRIERGRAVWYRNRWVRTPLMEAGSGFEEIPGGSNNQSNVAVVHHAGRLLTLGEVGWPYELRTSDLSTVGPFDFGGKLGSAMTAHPKVDPATGRMHFFGYGFTPPYLTYYVADRDGRLVLAEPVEVGKPSMIHDFAITDQHAVFWEGPVLFGAPGPTPGMPYGWVPSYGSRIGILPLEGPASAVRWIGIDTCFVFHGLNAHREGDDVVLVVSRLDSAFVPGRDVITDSPTRLHRWHIGTAGSSLTFRDETVTDLQMDLPTHDRRHTGRPVRHGWFTTTSDDGPWGFEFSGLCHLDLRTGRDERWEPGPLERAGEAFFVPAGRAEGEGWLLTYTYDRTVDRSHLAVLDAQDVARGPVARVHLPVRVPYGFHGLWVADP
jgi:carotenoid cleavage dioxygenase